ncbi:MAG: hypothetical protein ACLT2F_05675 [Butyricicoccus sp.]
MSGVSKAIVQPLLGWYDAGHRDLPWRSEPAPYRVWVSEIMLQQTRVEAVRGYFSRWMNALPDIPALAAADEAVYTKLWEGLGYYSRVRNLHRAAVLLCEEYGGELPADYDGCAARPASASTRQARWRLSRSDCPFRRWTAMFCVWRRGWITISRRSRTQNSKADARTVRRTHAVRPSRRPQPVADGAWCNRLSAERRAAL